MAKYSELSETQVAEALALYGVRPKSVAHIDGGAANTSYRVDCSDGSRIVLTVVDNAINLPALTLARLLRYLDGHGVAVPAPLEGRNGALIETFDGRPLLVKRFVAGECFQVLPLKHVGAAGAALAKVHAVTAPDWLPTGSRRLPDVSATLKQFGDEEFAAWVTDRIDETRTALHVSLPQGIVHGDYFTDNLAVDPDGKIGILDWETASRDAVLLDLGFAVVGLVRVAGTLGLDRAQTFIDGYRMERKLTDDEVGYLRDAVIYAATYLGYRRYERHHIRYPNPTKQDLFKEMPRFVESLRAGWPALTLE
ncbi:MAG TPA: phosphotransferase [Mycobacteriales bacterium]|jgi:homoserine kinase type II|nr:phosphotransferase [Mycobacteriales bacterium]